MADLEHCNLLTFLSEPLHELSVCPVLVFEHAVEPRDFYEQLLNLCSVLDHFLGVLVDRQVLLDLLASAGEQLSPVSEELTSATLE